MTTPPDEPAVLALLHAHLASGKANRRTCAVIYSMALGNWQSMTGHWRPFNDAIVQGLFFEGGLSGLRKLDYVKREGWKLYEATVERLRLPATAPKP